MSSSKTQFYPIIISPYLKLLQLAAGVLMMLLLLNQLFFNVSNNEKAVDRQFSKVSASYLQQATQTAIMLLNNKDKAQLDGFVDALASSDLVKDAILYDKDGQIIAQSNNSQTIRQLYGLEQGSNNTAPPTLSVVEEIRTTQVLGFIRLTMNEQDFTQDLKDSIAGQSERFRLIFVLAIVAGFLLTSGFERFTLTRLGGKLLRDRVKKAVD